MREETKETIKEIKENKRKREMADRYFDAIVAIAYSPRVKDFSVGYTYRTAAHRLREQRRYDKWYNVVTIAEKMTYNDARTLEIYLQYRCIEEDRRYVTYTKYYGPHRMRAYNPGKKSPLHLRDEKIHSIYMMWRETD
jgi:hypothetical protein